MLIDPFVIASDEDIADKKACQAYEPSKTQGP